MTRVDLTVTTPLGPVTISGAITSEDQSNGLNPADAVAAWLANIDSSELERVALENMDGSYTEGVLCTLRRWASGHP